MDYKQTVEVVIESSLCCGCLCCRAACPFNAIKSTCDKYGYVVPIVDGDKCRECGICLKCCPMSDFIGR